MIGAQFVDWSESLTGVLILVALLIAAYLSVVMANHLVKVIRSMRRGGQPTKMDNRPGSPPVLERTSSPSSGEASGDGKGVNRSSRKTD